MSAPTDYLTTCLAATKAALRPAVTTPTPVILPAAPQDASDKGEPSHDEARKDGEGHEAPRLRG